jgi:hypothetical protein
MMNVRPVRKLWLTLLLGALALGGAQALAWSQDHMVTLVEFTGPTTVRRAGTANYVPAESKMTLLPGDIVRTGPNASAVLVFPNGSVIRLRENGALRVPRMPAAAEAMRARLEAGRLRRERDRPRGDQRPPRPPGDMGRPPGDRPRDLGPRPGPPGPDGGVMVRRSGTRLFVKVDDQIPLNPGDIVRTGTHSHVLILFADGSRIKLRENSALLIPAAIRRKGPGPVALARVLHLPPPPPPGAEKAPQIAGGKDAP